MKKNRIWIILSLTLIACLIANVCDGRRQYPKRIPVEKIKIQSLVHNATAVSTSIENDAVETTFDNASYTFSGTSLRVGDLIEVEGLVWVEDIEAADTLQLRLYFGTEVVWNSSAVDAADNDLAYFKLAITVNAIGAGGKIASVGIAGFVTTTMETIIVKLDEADESMSGSVEIKFTGDWNNKHAGNICECKSFSVKRTTIDGV